jgi:hypothetical protein
VTEFGAVMPHGATDEVSLPEVALFVEDAFGIVLSDDEICEENLDTLEATERFVCGKLGRQHGCVESVE